MAQSVDYFNVGFQVLKLRSAARAVYPLGVVLSPPYYHDGHGCALCRCGVPLFMVASS